MWVQGRAICAHCAYADPNAKDFLLGVCYSFLDSKAEFLERFEDYMKDDSQNKQEVQDD